MLTQVFGELKIDGNWQLIDLSKYTQCYLIAVKQKTTKKTTIDADSIKRIRLQLGIESGIKGKPLTIQYINLNFDDMTSGDNEVNKITAFAKLQSVPNQFYIKVTSVDTGLKEYKAGITSISLNVNALNAIQ